ncbi:SdrD B-like domain-containing protein [Bacteroidota bacterium]
MNCSLKVLMSLLIIFTLGVGLNAQTFPTSKLLITNTQVDTCGGYDVYYNGVTYNPDGTSTWSYTMTGVDPQWALSHWVLALCENHVVDSASPSPWEVVLDPWTQLYGIKWDVLVEKDGSTTFIVTLDKHYDEAEVVQIAIKEDGKAFYCTTVGPSCDEIQECENTIGDFIWHDTNTNGLQDSGEPGIPGVDVELLDMSDNLLQTTATNTSGLYQFTGVLNGTYKVKVADSNFDPGGVFEEKSNLKWYATFENAGDDTKDSDGGKTSHEAVVTVNCNDDYTIDFGFFKVCMTLEKTGPTSVVEAGQTITYHFAVHNCGDVLLSGGVDVYDSLLNSTPDHWIKNVTVPKGTVEQFTVTYTTTEEDCGQLINNAWAIGHPSLPEYSGFTTVRDEASWTVTVECPPECENSVGDFVWEDYTTFGAQTNCNGIQDPGEPGIPGVKVYLKDMFNNILGTATTNQNGYYLFSGLCPGCYIVEVDANTLPAGYTPTIPNVGDDTKDSDGINHQALVCLQTNTETNLTIDFGYCPPPPECEGSIGDFVWKDFTILGAQTNCNGIQDPGEPGIPGVKVYLKDPTGAILDSTITNPGGFYLFSGLCAGCYIVEVDATTLPLGYTQTLPNVGDDTKDSDGINHQALVCLQTNTETNLTIDFGYCPPPPECEGSIGDFIWSDFSTDDSTGTNCNGIQDPGEPGIPGVTVYLKNPTGATLATTTTNSGGYYLFSGLCAGCYIVEVDATTLPAGYTQAPANVGDDTKDSDGINHQAPVCLQINTETNLTIDFGYCPPPPECEGSIGDFIWSDFSTDSAATNCNGIQDPGEPGIPGVKVYLKDAQDSVIAMTVTNSYGYYIFTGLCAGCYTVWVDESTLPSGYNTATATDQGSDDTKDSDGSGVQVCLTNNNTTDLTIDFGYCWDGCGGCEEACIGDFVWFDTNGDGIQDQGEPGVSGVAVELHNDNGFLIATDTTDNNGFYGFYNLIPGYYYVQFILPQGYSFTSKDQGSDDQIDSDAGVDGKTVKVLLLAGGCDLSWDAGLVETPPEPSCLGDRVWFDKDHDGIQDIGELGVQGVVVKLYDGSGTSLLNTTVTDAVGYYKFDNLVSGTYKIKFELPAGYIFTLLDQGSDDEVDSDAHSDGFTAVISLGVSECQLNWDAGLYADLPDLRLIKEVDNPNPEVGEQIKFTVVVTNDGPGDATGIKVTDYMPEDGLTFNNWNASQGSFNSSDGIWNVGSLSAGQSATLELFFTVEEYGDNVDFEEFDLGIAGDYNVFVLCSVNLPSSDTECKMAVGWDAYLSYYSIGDKLPNSNGEEDALVVGKNLTFTSGAVYGGNVVYGISTNLPQDQVSIVHGSLIQDPDRINFSAAGVYLKSLSSQLASYDTNGTTTYQWGGLTLVGTDPILNVFQVSGADLTNAHTLTIDVPNGSVVIVNIDGDNIEWSGGLIVNGTSINNVLYNFYQATFIRIQGIDVLGSILAPCATVDFVSGQQHGQMIAKYLIGRGQYNCDYFLGHIPGRPNVTNIAEITEVDQNDPDSYPGNGVPSEDDYSAATVYFDDNGEGGTGGDNGDWELIGSFDLSEIVWSIKGDSQGNLYVGTVGGNLYRSYDEGSTWNLLNSSMTVGFIWSIALHPNGSIYLGTEQGIFYSTDDGNTWSGPVGGSYDVRALAIDPSTGDIYAGTWGFGVIKSVDNGLTWLPVNTGLGSLVVTSLTIDGNGYVYAGTFGDGVYQSVDGGASWQKTALVMSLIWAMDVTSTDHIYVATYGGGVHRSLDYGMTWEAVNTGLEYEHVYAIAIDGNDNVYVSTWTGGIYKLTGISPAGPAGMPSVTSLVWEKMGMNGLGISALMVDRNIETIYAGGESGQIFRRKIGNITDVEEVEVPTEFKLSQNYPNPFNPSTTIEFSIPESGKYRLQIYNSLGEIVAVLMDDILNPGIHTVSFDARNLSSGIYMYQIYGNNVNITKKMILMK